MKKNLKSVIAIFAIIAVVYTLFATLIPYDRSAASWIAFGFTLLSIAGCLGTCILAFKGGASLISKIYGLPIFKVGGIYMVAQIVVSAILFVLDGVCGIAFWVSLLPCILLLGAAGIGVIATNAVKETIVSMEDDTKVQTAAMKKIWLLLRDAEELCVDGNAKASLKMVVEAARYSDPVSNAETDALEQEIIAKIQNMLNDMRNGSTDKLLEQIADVERAIQSRNRVCKASK